MRKKYRVKRHAVTQPLDPSYRLIPLTRGQNAIVDTEDWDFLACFNWTAKWYPQNKMYYAVRRTSEGKIQKMHRVLLGEPKGKEVDHKDRNGLNNRKNNLRPCTRFQNCCNMGRRKDNTSGFRGISFDRRRGKWAAEIKRNGKHAFLGYFDEPTDAARARDAAAAELHGDFAVLNFPPS